MKDIIFQIKGILSYNRDGSFATQAKRADILYQVARELYDNLGFKIKNIYNLKPQHVEVLVKSWQSRGLSVSTIKDKISALRWLSVKINKPDLIPPDNKSLGISNRVYVDNINKAIRLSDPETRERWGRIKNPNIKIQIELQSKFGLRFEESAKFKPWEADKGDHLYIHYGTKGGRERKIPIRTQEQRELINRCKSMVKPNESMIPSNKTYASWKNTYHHAMTRAGFTQSEAKGTGHGFRHGYAQDSYTYHTSHHPDYDNCPDGLSAPITYSSHDEYIEDSICRIHAENLAHKELVEEIHELDHYAREQVNDELGHGRERMDVSAQYLGS